MIRFLLILLVAATTCLGQGQGLRDPSFLALLTPKTGAAPPSGSTLTNGLMAWYSMDETSGNRSDLSPFASTLNVSNTVNYEAAGAGMTNLVVLDTADGFLTSPSATNLQFIGTTWTLTCWIYLTTLGDFTILCKDGAADANREFMLWYDNSSDGVLKVDLMKAGTPGTRISVGYGSGFNQEQLYWICIRYTNSTLYLRVDNAVESEVNSSWVDSNAGGAGNFTIGKDENVGGYWYGKIDGVGKWSRCLTETEISTLYNSGNGKQYPFE